MAWADDSPDQWVAAEKGRLVAYTGLTGDVLAGSACVADGALQEGGGAEGNALPLSLMSLSLPPPTPAQATLHRVALRAHRGVSGRG